MSLSVFEFGKQLVESRDLDPVYVAVYEYGFPPERLADFLLLYWCFYHCGTVSWIMAHGGSEKEKFWEALSEAANGKTHPRATERRHFRGKNAKEAVLGLRSLRLTGFELVKALAEPNAGEALGKAVGGPAGGPSLGSVVARIGRWKGFGPWIGFKAADMLERLGVAPIAFRPSDVFKLYDAPRKGADLVIEQYGLGKGKYLAVYNLLIRELGKLKAPPRYERTLNIQEVETILCKYKSHLSGHYEVGKDIEELRHGLEKYHHCATASGLLLGGHKGGLWSCRR